MQNVTQLFETRTMNVAPGMARIDGFRPWVTQFSESGGTIHRVYQAETLDESVEFLQQELAQTTSVLSYGLQIREADDWVEWYDSEGDDVRELVD